MAVFIDRSSIEEACSGGRISEDTFTQITPQYPIRHRHMQTPTGDIHVGMYRRIANFSQRPATSTRIDNATTHATVNGQPIDDPFNPDFRTVSAIGSLKDTGNEDGRPSSFNDLGQLVFQASFTDGSEGIFVANAVAVPEPSSVLTILAGTALSFFLRRHGNKRPKTLADGC
jgi:hypothetical protein